MKEIVSNEKEIMRINAQNFSLSNEKILPKKSVKKLFAKVNYFKIIKTIRWGERYFSYAVWELSHLRRNSKQDKTCQGRLNINNCFSNLKQWIEYP